MPQRVTDEAVLAKLNLSEENVTKWDTLIKQIIKDVGFSNTTISRNLKPWTNHTLPNGDQFDEQGRIWYELSEEDQSNLKQLIRDNRYSESDRAKSFAGSKYFVISLNPIDKLMSATGQTFASCMSLDSSYSGGFAFNIPTLFPNKGIMVGFFSKGEQKNYPIGGEGEENKYRYNKMMTRNFLYLLDDGKIGIGRTYPSESYLGGFETMLNELMAKVGLTFITNNNQSEKKLKHKIYIYKDEYGVPRTTYFDDVIMTYREVDQYVNNNDENGYLTVYTRSNGQGGIYNKFKHKGGTTLSRFLSSPNKKAEMEKILSISLCKECGKFHFGLQTITHVHVTKTGNTRNYNIVVCPECLDTHYVYCKNCSGYHKKDNNVKMIDLNEEAEKLGIKNRVGSSQICEARIASYVKKCDHCGDLMRYNSTYGYGNNRYCGECYNRIRFCNICDTYFFAKDNEFHHVDHRNQIHCQSCYEKALVKQANKDARTATESVPTPVEQVRLPETWGQITTLDEDELDIL